MEDWEYVAPNRTKRSQSCSSEQRVRSARALRAGTDRPKPCPDPADNGGADFSVEGITDILTEPWVGYRFRDPSDPDAAPLVPDTDDAESDY